MYYSRIYIRRIMLEFTEKVKDPPTASHRFTDAFVAHGESIDEEDQRNAIQKIIHVLLE